MPERPLVSVMMPCFNAEASLPMAIASLAAQTHPNWEAVMVDDGSTDGTAALIEGLRDPRLRLTRFKENKGRGAARQKCLELARGEYLAFLDADDWLYPDKLATQVSLLEQEPSLSLVSTASVITRGTDTPVGQTRAASLGAGTHTDTLSKPGPPPFEFPSSMIRMDVAKSGHFDPAFLRSQDSDFINRVMLGKNYAVLSTPLYAYSQDTAASLSKTLQGYGFRLRTYRRYKTEFPLTVATLNLKTQARIATYKLAGVFGLERHLIARRWNALTPDAERDFRPAFETVARMAQDMFQGMGNAGTKSA